MEMGWPRNCNWVWGIFNPSCVWHKTETFVNVDLTKEGLKCIGKPMHLALDGVESVYTPTGLGAECVDACFEDRYPLVLLQGYVFPV